MLHGIHMHKVETLYLFGGSKVNLGSFGVIGVKFWFSLEMYYLFYITKYVHVIHTLASHLQDNRETGVSQGSMSQSRQGTPSVTATCLVILPAQPAGSCILLVSSFFFFFLHRRMQCACILFLLNSSHTSFCQPQLSNVSHKDAGNQFWGHGVKNLVTMTNDLARRCPMTFDPVKGHSRSQGSNINIFLKNFSTQPGYVVCIHMTHAHDSP